MTTARESCPQCGFVSHVRKAFATPDVGLRGPEQPISVAGNGFACRGCNIVWLDQESKQHWQFAEHY